MKANEVGGDFYDVFPLEQPGHWAVVIGDVCGTGPEAAALTGLARHSIRESAWHGDTPVEVLRSLHRAVKNSATDTFLTALYATLDTSGPRPTLTVTCGGHPLPIHVDGDTTTAVGPGSQAPCSGCSTPSSSPPRRATSTRAMSSSSTPTEQPTSVLPTTSTAPTSVDLVQRAVHRGATAEAIADQIHDALESSSRSTTETTTSPSSCSSVVEVR